MDAQRLALDSFTFVATARPPSPIILTVPHDGIRGEHLCLPFPERTNGVTVRDGAVWNIVSDIAATTPMNVIRGLLPRTLVDYNRAAAEAYEHEAIRAPYDAYHDQIDCLIRSLKTPFPVERILLLDMHGFGAQPPYAPVGGYDVILGTGNRTTVAHGDADRRLATFLRDRGYSVFLPEREPVRIGGDYLAGQHTVRSYSAAHGINCIQVEMARRFRERGAERIGQALARDIAVFLSSFSSLC